TFGGNEATKKTKKNQLKQQYGNFKAEGKETLETAGHYDLYNHLKVYEPEVQQTLKALMAIDRVGWDWSYMANEEENHALVADEEAPIEFALMAKSSYENKIDEDDTEEMDIKWNMALLSMRADILWKKTRKKITIQGSYVAGFDKSKVECFNCHKMGHFARECRVPRSQDKGWDWSYMANEEEDHALVADQEAPKEFALMAKSSSDTEVQARLVEFKNQEIKFCEKIRGLEFKVESKDNRIERLTKELEELKKEKEGLDSKLTGYNSVPPSCSSLLTPKKDMSWIGLPEFVDDSITDYSRPSPSIESNSSDFSVFKNEESSESILSKPMIKFVKAADSPTVITTNKVETARKPSIKYAEMYRDTQKSPKDETSGILRNFITEIENLKELKVKVIRFDNRGEFRNKEINDFCSRKGIKREFSNAETPQQNGVVERRNKTLIEAAKTILADAKLPVTFWAEAVNTACYVKTGSCAQDACNADATKSSGNSNPSATSTNPSTNHMETLTVETPIPTISSPMDVKSAFLFGTIDEEVYVMQPPRFQDPEFLARVYKRYNRSDTVYQKAQRRFHTCTSENPWGKDETGKDVDLHLYRFMIGSLMYLTASRPDIMFAVCACARHQVTPKECHLHAVKRIFRYLKGHPKLGLWYPKESPFDLVAYSDCDYGGATQDQKSTTGGC
nr:uncharacterized mitochondrial protein AtMg00810-like [Tanacetum cinerariifolium]